MFRFLARRLALRHSLPAFCLLLAVTLSCGDAVVIFSTNFGTVVSDAHCTHGGGNFDLRDQQGLVLLVVIDSGTAIFLSSGASGTCTDLVRGAEVEVRGENSQGEFDAREVRLR
jgi:hypothetical protein